MSTLTKSANLGERLEEARKRRGISLREAAEATKIRSDYLQMMENNQFEIPLPTIYQRGFLRNYARYLKLDTEKIMADFDAWSITQNRGGRRQETREALGRMELGEGHGQAVAEKGQDNAAAPDHGESDRKLWMKIALIVSACTILALVIVIAIRMATPPAQPGSNASSTPSESPATTPTANQPVLLVASDAVGVIVRQAADNREIFRGSLAPGEEKEISASGELIIQYTKGSALEIERSGKRYKMAQTGPGFSRLK